MEAKVKEALDNFLDALETQYGELEGIELRFEHVLDSDSGEREKFATVKEFILVHLTRTSVEL